MVQLRRDRAYHLLIHSFALHIALFEVLGFAEACVSKRGTELKRLTVFYIYTYVDTTLYMYSQSPPLVIKMTKSRQYKESGHFIGLEAI